MTHLARTTDPPTSHENAAEASKRHPDERVCWYVVEAMRDGAARHDEAIADKVNDALAVLGATPLSESRIRHGRKLAADRGRLVDTGSRAKTRSGGTSRVWVFAG